MSTYSSITVDFRDAAAVITLNRPEALNAFTYPMMEEIHGAVLDAVSRRSVVGLVITGNGRGFSAGLDASALTAVTNSGGTMRASEPEHGLPGLFSYLIEQPKPVIAAVNGVTAGGGMVLASKCDLRFASTSASFLTVFSKRGLIAEHGMTWLMPRMVGLGDALDLMWSSRRLEAAEAHRIGYVQRIFEPEELLNGSIAYINDLAANTSPGSLADTKRLAYRHIGMEYPEAFVEADDAAWVAISRPDAAEGAASLTEKRLPNFERLGNTD
jgi:enoyl-CoA hydratase/carnithine racemase